MTALTPESGSAPDGYRGNDNSQHVPDYDVLIIGSGFGGSVSALRLAEKGYRVGVLEAGRRFSDEDFAKTSWQLRKFLWAPKLDCYGIQRIHLLRKCHDLGGRRRGRRVAELRQHALRGAAAVLRRPAVQPYHCVPNDYSPGVAVRVVVTDEDWTPLIDAESDVCVGAGRPSGVGAFVGARGSGCST